MADIDQTKDRLPPQAHDYRKSAPRSSIPVPRLRAHETVLVQPTRQLPIADLAARAKDEKDGGKVLQKIIGDLKQRRIDTAIMRRNGQMVVDHEAEALSFRTISDMPALRKALDFDIAIEQRTKDGGTRSITSTAFALLTGALAHADATVGAESVPSVVDEMVQDMDDIQKHTEIPELLEFPLTSADDEPLPLGETEEYREVSAGEDRYTILHYKDGYQRAFSQDMLDLGGPQVASQLMDLGRGSMEVMEMFALRRLVDTFGSRSVPVLTKATMIRNRVGAALFSETANTPSTRTPNGTRILNNALADITDLEAIRALLAGYRNSKGHAQPALFRKMLVPDALFLRAWTIFNSVTVPGVFGEENFFGPNGVIRAQILSTPFLDILSTTAWWAGDPQRQFVRKFRRRPEVAVHGGTGTEAYVRTHEGMRVRIGWDMQVGVRAHTFMAASYAGNAASGPGG